MIQFAQGHKAQVDVRLLDAGETSELLSISRRTLARLTASGAIPSVLLNTCRRYRSDALRAWIAKGAPTEPGAGEAIMAELGEGVQA
ncbi:MAG: helix-turn-helix domain-containing protein [Phycisphaerales bacterium]